VRVEEWRSQSKRGTLELCILLMIEKRERYGYELISELEKRPVLAAKESTIYPLLRRLLGEGLLSSCWRESAEGLPPRKYYSLTNTGQTYLQTISAVWEDLSAAIQEIKEA
jgi:PadR family transcriptional regulator PadR